MEVKMFFTHQLLADIGLDDVDPLRNLHLAGLLEVSSEGHGEVLLTDVLDTAGWHGLVGASLQV